MRLWEKHAALDDDADRWRRFAETGMCDGIDCMACPFVDGECGSGGFSYEKARLLLNGEAE